MIGRSPDTPPRSPGVNVLFDRLDATVWPTLPIYLHSRRTHSPIGCGGSESAAADSPAWALATSNIQHDTHALGKNNNKRHVNIVIVAVRFKANSGVVRIWA
ncbi:hypothetical protein RhiXN_10885 [Rhizoctonia solani]|uniref:Uncharacterized protein n=1 Tax=Rhizoctonia solani TaxID=456999 RepID=A0A8H8P8L3_9AGAM|nr:uncharacterized protein RhiXN_10885 [Rhizoctonia solani]QRW25808.1 hypothetical protein RhiXN_10885 [Rhizoctonia solani]